MVDHPYRSAPLTLSANAPLRYAFLRRLALSASVPLPRYAFLRRPWCWIADHCWKVVRDAGAAHLMQFHPYAGCDAFCLRCGATWLDFDRYTRIHATLLESAARELLERGGPRGR